MKRKLASLMLAMVLLLTMTTVVSAADPYDNYVYDSEENPQQEPQAYIPERVVAGADLDELGLSNPKDLFVTKDGKIYIADTGNNRILVLDGLNSVERVISGFQNGDTKETFNAPQGVFVTDEHTLYVADTGNHRIVRLDAKDKLVATYGTPTSSLYSGKYAYDPVKLVVDKAERMYVVSLNSSEGIIELNPDGEFMAYFGAITTMPSLGQILRRMLPFDFLKDTTALNIPTEYSSVCIDDLDMVYGTVGIIDGEKFDPSHFIHRLNPSGFDILKRNGINPPMGDVQLQRDEETDTMLTSFLCDVAVRDHGIYSVLDQRLGRVFTYSSDGELMYIFGGKGDSLGQVGIPAALDVYNGKYLVLDSHLNQIVVYKPTLYGDCINDAIESYFSKDYETSSAKWNEALSYTSKSSLVYNGVADTAYKALDYKRAMYYYKLAQNREGYSKAFKYARQELLTENFSLIVIVLAVLVAAYIAYRIYRKFHPKKEREERNTLWEQLRYSTYVIFHPFKGFWDLKHAKKGSMLSAWILALAMIVVFILRRQLTGFVINTNDVSEMNILVQFSYVLLPLFLWCAANWAITTLMEGEGTIKEIFITTCYALTPVILMNIPMLILSNVLALDEMSVYTLLGTVSIIWAVCLLIVGIQTIHQFSMGKTIATMLIAVLGMAVLAAIGLLFISLIQQMVNFVEISIFEISMR